MLEKRPLIIDCDPGIDDFVAILLANSCGQFDIRAITTLGGNVLPQYTARNAKNIAAMIGLDCPIGRGAQKPLMHEIDTADYIHGVDGIGGVELPESDRPFDERPAWDIIYDEACKFPGQLEVAAIGPLTNIAILFRKYPEVVRLIKKLHIMGGSTTTGNHSPYGEFNIWEDVLAADIVFNSGVELRMVGLDCTRQGQCDKQVWHQGLQKPGLVISKLREMMAFDPTQTELYRQHRGIKPPKDVENYVPGLPDAVTMAGMIDEDLLQCQKYYVMVETTGPLTYGWTMVDWNMTTRKPFNCEVALKVDTDRITELYHQMFEFYEGK